MNGTPVPTSMSTRGKYRFTPQRIGNTNGAGVAQKSGSQSVEWVFSYLNSTEMAFFTTTLLAGALSVTLTAAELKDDLFADQTFTSAVLYKPTYDVYQAGLFRNCTVQLKHLLPLIY